MLSRRGHSQRKINGEYNIRIAVRGSHGLPSG